MKLDCPTGKKKFISTYIFTDVEVRTLLHTSSDSYSFTEMWCNWMPSNVSLICRYFVSSNTTRVMPTFIIDWFDIKFKINELEYMY